MSWWFAALLVAVALVGVCAGMATPATPIGLGRMLVIVVAIVAVLFTSAIAAIMVAGR